jgi:PhnB protein
MAVQPIPDGYPRVTPYLICSGAGDAIDFYTKVLGGTERMRLGAPGDRVGHAEISFGDSIVMLADEFPDMGIQSPKTIGGTPVSVCLYVEDVDDVYKRAIAEGATQVEPVEDKFYGDRAGQIEDPWGHRWNLMTHVEDVSPEEMHKRAAEYADQM